MEQKRLPIFSERFAELRGDATQGEFAEFLGISRPTVGFYENGSRIPDALVLRQIAEKCNVSADWLLGLSQAKTTDIAAKEVCEYTGLSEISVKILHLVHLAGANTLQNALDFLLLDMWEKDEGSDLNSVMDLLLFFLQYNPSTPQINAVLPSGHIVDTSGKQLIGHALFLNNRTIENATLSELTQALIALKQRYQGQI